MSDVQIVGTQPWPIGRYGSCELMIGCIARATSYEVLLNPTEMEDVQVGVWGGGRVCVGGFGGVPGVRGGCTGGGVEGGQR